MEAILLCFMLTLFPIFDLPVFWPVLVVYFVVEMFEKIEYRCSLLLPCVIV